VEPYDPRLLTSRAVEATAQVAPGHLLQGAAGTVPSPAGAANSSRRVELSEPDSGFIRIEPSEKPESAAAVTPAGTVPSISLSIVPAGSGLSVIDEARRAERLAQAAWQRRDGEEARRQYSFAARLYETVARSGGEDAGSARSGLDACRRALEALR
jgi:hypothetical protein